MKKMIALAALAGAFAISVSAALAGPLMLGPTAMPVAPKVLVNPVIIKGQAETQVLNSYRQLRSFWLSRAIVR